MQHMRPLKIKARHTRPQSDQEGLGGLIAPTVSNSKTPSLLKLLAQVTKMPSASYVTGQGLNGQGATNETNA